ncbi:hypothetical protein NUSPORA_02349 [Nucleospora cyclopteri]
MFSNSTETSGSFMNNNIDFFNSQPLPLDNVENKLGILNENKRNTVVVYKYIILKTPTTIFDIIPFLSVFSIYCFIIHTILMIIKKLYKNAYNCIVMFFIIIFPPLTMVLMKDYVFILIWGFLMGFFLYCIRIGFSKGLLARENPKKIYKMFKTIFSCTNVMIGTSQLGVIAATTCFPTFTHTALRFLVYSLYFGVFCREVMFNLSRIMARTTGFYSSKDTLNSIKEDYSKCMICCNSLVAERKRIYTNTCGHSFHLECIKGWALLANNFFCVYCKKNIEDTKELTKDLWYKAENTMRPLMNFLRSSISFFVVLYFFMMYRLK